MDADSSVSADLVFVALSAPRSRPPPARPVISSRSVVHIPHIPGLVRRAARFHQRSWLYNQPRLKPGSLAQFTRVNI